MARLHLSMTLTPFILTELTAGVDKMRRWFEPGACFAAGTLVHTKEGLKPIEQIQVGDWVLSKPENGGEQAYKRVVKTFAHEPQRIVRLNYTHPGQDLEDLIRKAQVIKTDYINTTLNHPFWTKEEGWTAPSHMQGCGIESFHFEDKDGDDVGFWSVQDIYISDLPDVGWTSNSHPGGPDDSRGSLWDYAQHRLIESNARALDDIRWGEHPDPYFKAPVYNLEVEDFHTYYVGEHGIWVHNTNGPKTDGVSARAIALNKAEANARLDIETCFAAGTLVHTKEGLRPIEELQVGDLVLTWPEDKPIPVRPCYPFRLEEEYIYKPVTRTFVHEDQMVSHVVIRGSGKTPNDDETLLVTPNHPFWSKQRGWVPASVLKFGYTLKQANFADNLIRGATHDVERVTVYNIEVAECHTYFVGERGIWVHNKGEDIGSTPVGTGSSSSSTPYWARR